MSKRQKLAQLGDHGALRVPRITVIQQPPGSGKTYGMVNNHLCTAAEQGYRWVFVLTKPHSAKEVVRREIDEQFARMCETKNAHIVKQHYFQKCHIIEVRFDEDCIVRFFIATGDSFLWPQWKQTEGGPNDLFQKVCVQIAESGPASIYKFKGASGHVSERALVCIDEATKFDVWYYDTFMRIAKDRKCDVVVAGDIMQSIETSDNLLTRMMTTKSIPGVIQVDVDQGNEVRRCGQSLVDMFTTVVGHETYEKHGLELPVSVRQEFEPTYEIHTHKEIPESICGDFIDVVSELAQDITDQMIKDVRRLHLLPYDVIVVIPNVKKNPLPCILQTFVNEAWQDLLQDDDYVTSMHNARGDEFATYMTDHFHNHVRREWFCVHHYSEAGTPIDTRRSDASTRIVSVHASQGDGRRLAITVGLTYRNLCKFIRHATPETTLQYNSFVNVALSRCKQHQTVWLEQRQNDIWNRFKPFLTEAQQEEIPPSVTGMCKCPQYGQVKLDVPLKDRDTAPLCKQLRDKLESGQQDFCAPDQVVEWEHHAVSLEVFCIHAMIRLSAHGSLKSFRAIIGGSRGTGNKGIAHGSLKLFPRPKAFYEHLKQKDKTRKNFRENLINGQSQPDPLSEDWPLIEQTGKGWQLEACEHIQTAMHELKAMLRDFCNRGKDSRLMDKNAICPMHFVCLSYLIELQKHGTDVSLSNATLCDIARAYMYGKEELVNMYDRVKGCENIMDHVQRVCGEGEWEHNPRMNLGTTDNASTPYFHFRIPRNERLWLHTNTEAATFMLITPVGPSLDSIITTILASALIAWQPDCSNADAKTPRKVHKKHIHAIVVDVNTGQVNHFRDLHESLVREHPLVIDRILLELESSNRTHHKLAARMICTHEGRDELAQRRRRAGKYSRVPEHVFQVATMVEEEDIESDIAIVKEKLDKKLSRHIEVFRKSTCADT